MIEVGEPCGWSGTGAAPGRARIAEGTEKIREGRQLMDASTRAFEERYSTPPASKP